MSPPKSSPSMVSIGAPVNSRESTEEDASRYFRRASADSRRASAGARLLFRAATFATLLISLLCGTTVVCHADLDKARAHLLGGEYTQCLELASAAIEEGTWSSSWPYLKIRAELATGKYAGALSTLEASLERYPLNLRLRHIGHEVYLRNNRPDEARELIARIKALVNRNPWQYDDASHLIILGRVLLLDGADARRVLEVIYDRVVKEQPDFVDVYLAMGELALGKQDYEMAATSFEAAAKLRKGDADIYWRLAQAYRPGDPVRMSRNLRAATERNPRHVPALLMLVDSDVDTENYTRAEERLSEIFSINPDCAEAWAYRAVLAHLRGDIDAEDRSRQRALSTWIANPSVDFLIGKKLAQNYRFAEAELYQRRALKMDPHHSRAKLELSHDLLRLGKEEEGWRLAAEVSESDNYNVVAYNLGALREHLASFRTLEDDHFIVRMDAHEAAVYGEEVLSLLHLARATLNKKYDVPFGDKVTVEIFPEQADFAIRTFGLPGGAGFLGVCFGKLITANSPASQGDHPSNWKAVLWHEYTHVVTLSKTRNKMPRWLSEGISVYEERIRDPAWGQSMTPRYRQMITGGELTPVSELSAAFLQPPSALHLQFAYYESALVVEYLVEKHGLGTLLTILEDLSEGVGIRSTLARVEGSTRALDQSFETFANRKASAFGSSEMWKIPDLEKDADLDAIAEWNELQPDQFFGLMLWARELVRQKKWNEARKPLERVIELCPEYAGSDSAYQLLAVVLRKLQIEAEELNVLERLAERSADSLDAYDRLMKLAAHRDDWNSVLKNADRFLAVNPLLRETHRMRADAATLVGDKKRAIASQRALAEMDPVDPAGVHFRLARLLFDVGEIEDARRHVLECLGEAPRYREALALLLEITRSRVKPAKPDPDPRDTAPVVPDELAPSTESVKTKGTVRTKNAGGKG